MQFSQVLVAESGAGGFEAVEAGRGHAGGLGLGLVDLDWGRAASVKIKYKTGVGIGFYGSEKPGKFYSADSRPKK